MVRRRPGTRFSPMDEALPNVCGSCERHRRYHELDECLGLDELREARRLRRGD